MKVAPLITVALIICIAFPCPIQAKKKPKPNKFCIGKDGNQYAVGQGYDDNDGKACVHYKCVKKKKKFVMKQGKCAVDGEWGDWSSWSDCSATCGSAIKKRTRTCSNPKPSNGGKPCHGQDKEVEECSLKACENTPTTPSIVAATSTALPIATTKPGATCTTPFQNILVVAKKGKKPYKFTCDFIMVYTNKAVVISKSSVWCKPPKGPKGLKVKVILKGDDELQFDAIVSIFPFAITAATVKGSKCNEEPTTKEPVTELPPGPVENVNVTALELNLQSLNDTVQSMLELISTMQSTANKQGTCLSDLSSSECPASAAGKVGVVDGIAVNTANITTNTAGLASSKAGIATNQAGVATNQAGIVTNQAGIATNQAGIATNQAGVATNKEDITFNNDTCSSIQATATKLETCLSDVNSVDCPSSKGGKTSVPDAIIKNKDAVETHHPDTTPTITPTSTTATTATSSTTTAVTFLPCVGSWCRQSGTKDQFTRCESVRDGGLTCVNPEVRYGSTEGGIPGKYIFNDYDAWCQQVLGFGSNSKVTYGARDCAAPKGRLLWVNGYDESGYKWCDGMDGYWKDATLDNHSGCATYGITSLTCSK